ncbi:MAG: hypothetical protein NHB15_08650 [Methanosarcina barkeri]|nr:hypothetical protein [Methanosarcina sp. ERenArc_MAG2]
MKITAMPLQNPLNYSSRESLLIANSKLIAHLQDRLAPKRFRAGHADGIKLAYMRVFLQALQVQNAMLKDLELDEMKKRLEALENSQNEKVGASQAYTPTFRSLNVDSCNTP